VRERESETGEKYSSKTNGVGRIRGVDVGKVGGNGL
jgi:hypothetical protein